MRAGIWLRASLALVLLAAVTGCADRTSMSAAYAPEYANAPHANVSVLGVYRDGRMDASAWDAMAPDVARALHSARCPAGYGEVWSAESSPFPEQVDRATAMMGVSDDWLDQVAPAARGDLVLVIAEVHGPPRAPPAKRSASGGGLGSVGKGKGALVFLPVLAVALLLVALVPEPSGPEPPPLDLAAMLYSRKAHRTVAAVAVHAVGESLAEARKDLAAKMGAEWTGMVCAGWGEVAPVVSVDGG